MIDTVFTLPLFAIVLTISTFRFGLWCQKKTGSVLLNPMLISTLLVIGVLLITGIDVEAYQTGTAIFSWLMTPATVCFAVPLYGQLKLLRKNVPAILAGVVAGTLTGLAAIALLCLLFALDKTMTISILPKSITSAMGIVISGQNGGIESLTSVTIIMTGIFGNVTGPALCKFLKLNDPISQGVAYGTASHVIGTSRAMESNPIAGAVSSLSLVVAGILTVILFPLICFVL